MNTFTEIIIFEDQTRAFFSPVLNLFHAESSLGVNQSNIILIYAKNAKVTLMHVMPPFWTRREPDRGRGGDITSLWADLCEWLPINSVRRMNQWELVYLYQPHIITTFKLVKWNDDSEAIELDKFFKTECNVVID